ncbi:site-specific DNA-methyltransferase [Paraburkholderia sp. C35]|uniref:DNA-methyltransferase n=1 Tax=Paraburkholderia sp. C35 TaxID=2126993 RepID=UPI000D68A090|nr:site-specific DNA-methyltransferase [Paraburkholderia sp. C35]
MPRPKSDQPRSQFANIRFTAAEHEELEAQAASNGFKSISDYIRHLHQQSMLAQEASVSRTYEPVGDLTLFHKTRYGSMYLGNSLRYTLDKAKPASVDLIMTSPPFGLVRKKTYGNEDADQYCEWFRPFAEGFKRVLKDEGSLVIDIGGAWKPGTPTRSLYHYELLVMLCREFGFHLCLEHFWWNPAKLPTPAEWVNVRRVRVKDAVNCVWWLSKTPWPKASNRRVLAKYSDSMQSLLKNGYQARLRPSGHDISDKFQKDNGGAVPPNLLAIANTDSNSSYQEYCRKNNIAIHPARFPAQLPEYFIRMLTDPGDNILDPFGGSCMTGYVAESLGRHWTCVELEEEYLQGAKGRFISNVQPINGREVSYSISVPCANAKDAPEVPLIVDGGRARPKPQVPQ